MASTTAPQTERQGRAAYAGPADHLPKPYPLHVHGEVVKGFGRGSKQLGIPTANLSEEASEQLCTDLSTGIYFGWAQLRGSDQEVRPMVMSLGWNPYYKNEKRSAEVHIMHEYENDFYGQELRISILGYIRPELNYTGLDDLVEDIWTDIRVAKRSLDREPYQEQRMCSFFST
ncbi:riboflavin kinase [Piptocephalis cylindrospora]|uniref:Riboflavin kinase n=1 Tax=Piptocephalis cylindrospora TaxID=1907219 RepID=A0A4P9Y360_9FUNG|nr:riboflavin kinase [Piptocephalis cylindrospora]|eukprot:RKP13358.1 riboflavin kinase [Piptocephalis cylindrospora]